MTTEQRGWNDEVEKRVRCVFAAVSFPKILGVFPANRRPAFSPPPQTSHKAMKDLNVINDYFVSRELRGAGGGGHGGGGGGGSHHSSGSGTSSNCKTVKTNVYNETTGNLTAITSKQVCAGASPYIAFVALVPLLFGICFCWNWCSVRKSSANVQKKADACETLHHTLVSTTAVAMRAAGHSEYTQGYICDKCNTTHHTNETFWRCNICRIDFCPNCKERRPRPGMMHQMSFNYGHGYAATPVWQTQAYVMPNQAQVMPMAAKMGVQPGQQQGYEMVQQGGGQQQQGGAGFMYPQQPLAVQPAYVQVPQAYPQQGYAQQAYPQQQMQQQVQYPQQQAYPQVYPQQQAQAYPQQMQQAYPQSSGYGVAPQQQQYYQ